MKRAPPSSFPGPGSHRGDPGYGWRANRNTGCIDSEAIQRRPSNNDDSPLLVLPLMGLVACASGPRPEDPCATSIPPVTGWTVHDEGAFTIQLPPGYSRVDVQGIDSQVGLWEAPGKRISYDFGFYSNPLRQDDVHSFPRLVVCQRIL
jgi:hypothetical protein